MEKDLFDPIKSYFERYGYICDGEVGNTDLYMEKEGVSVAVELKLTLDFRAVQQAALRQKTADHVYIGIFRPGSMNTASFRDRLYLLKRLGIGLIIVSKRTKAIEIASEPVVTELSLYQQRNGGNRKALSEELRRRRVRNNTGGVRGVKLITSYREDALSVLSSMIEKGGTASTREIRSSSGVRRTTSILYDNHYGWFVNVSRGVYKVSETGYEAAEAYKDVFEKLRRMPED